MDLALLLFVPRKGIASGAGGVHRNTDRLGPGYDLVTLLTLGARVHLFTLGFPPQN